MLLILKRDPSTETETQGSLSVGGEMFDTIEPPWGDNKPFKSCLPAGNYLLVPHTGGRYKNTYCMVNEKLGVYHLPEERVHNTDRYACVFHAANWASQLEGCVALGLGKSTAYDKRTSMILPMVIRSRDAVRRFKILMHNNPGPHSLRIIDG